MSRAGSGGEAPWPSSAGSRADEGNHLTLPKDRKSLVAAAWSEVSALQVLAL